MTYPGQQGPYGQQPDPYWQQGGPPGWGPPPPPPRKPNAGLWVGLTIAVVLVAALGVTGFAWPGFFLASDDKPANAAGDDKPAKGGNCAVPADKEDPEPVAKAVAACISAKNKDVLRDLICDDAAREVRQVADSVERIERAKLTDTVTVSDTEARAVLELSAAGRTHSVQAVLVKADDTWCWKRTDAGDARPTTSARGKPSGRPSSSASGSPESKIGPPSGEGGEVLTKFVEALNDKDASAAKDLLCEGAKTTDDVDDVVGQNPEFTIDDNATETESWINVGLSGTLDGQMSGGVLSADKKDGGWCISDLLVL